MTLNLFEVELAESIQRYFLCVRKGILFEGTGAKKDDMRNIDPCSLAATANHFKALRARSRFPFGVGACGRRPIESADPAGGPSACGSDQRKVVKSLKVVVSR